MSKTKVFQFEFRLIFLNSLTNYIVIFLINVICTFGIFYANNGIDSKIREINQEGQTPIRKTSILMERASMAEWMSCSLIAY